MGLSPSAVYRAIWDGELRASKLRGRLRVQLADLDTWIDSNLVSTRGIREEPPAPLVALLATAEDDPPSEGRGQRSWGGYSVSALDEFVCAECGRKPRGDENASDEWRAYSDGVGELHVFCPECAEGEFGSTSPETGESVRRSQG